MQLGYVWETQLSLLRYQTSSMEALTMVFGREGRQNAVQKSQSVIGSDKAREVGAVVFLMFLAQVETGDQQGSGLHWRLNRAGCT